MISRRAFLQRTVGAAVLTQAPAIITSNRERPVIDYGVGAGDLSPGRAVVWAHVDRPSRMLVEYSTTESFDNVQRVQGGLATPDTGLTARALLTNVPAGQRLFYRVRFEDPASGRAVSEPVIGRFRSASESPRPVRIAWSADTCGQGWGIDPSRGGMRLFDTMRRAEPDLFLNVGDTVYADQPLRETVALDDGTIWRNVVTPSKAKVAETLDEFRGNHLYNRLDEHYKRFAAEVALVAMWDDHEVHDNWYPDQLLGPRSPHVEKRVSVLAPRARQAFLEHYPIDLSRGAETRIYRTIPYGPLLDVFALDMRSYRGANSPNMQETLSPESAFLGSEQAKWLADRIAASTAVWKIVAADMPLGLVVPAAPGRHEAVANADPGPPRGREIEIAGLLKELRARKARNVVWVTADVHYCAAHHYDPARAQFADFDPFWEFIAGPAHAGTFTPPPFDATFGPEMRFCGVPKDLAPNRPPSAGLQFYGTLDVDPVSRVLTVGLNNLAGERIYSLDLEPRT